MFCFHVFDVSSIEILASAWEQMVKDHKFTKIDRMPTSFFKKPAIVTRRCVKCGHTKVERI